MNEDLRIPQIAVCICTFKRPSQLKRLLEKLENQKTNDRFSFSVIVVDNDISESARSVAEFYRTSLALKVDYYVEPVQNISLARNKAIENAKCDYIALIDDDEVPIREWLYWHYDFLQRSQADGSLGPVNPDYETNPPKWVIRGRFFNRPNSSFGKKLAWTECRTGNALIISSVFAPKEAIFNPRYGSGSEDRDFFRRKISEGRIFRWCNRAVVFENIPKKRWQLSYMIKRALLRGVSNVHGSQPTMPSIMKSILAIAIYTLALPISIFFGYDVFIGTLVKDCDHLGKVLASFGWDIIKAKYIS